MQTVDIGILVLLALPAIIGVLYGFLKIAFSIVVWILASIIAAKFGDNFVPVVAKLTDTSWLQEPLAFVAVFILSLIILSIIAYFITKLLGQSGLTGADRILGLFFGLGLGGFIVAVIVFLAGFTNLHREDWWRNSLMIEPFQLIAVWGEQFLPEELASEHGYETEQLAEQPEEAV
jgi:membrane protein required for colicin V production